MNYDIEGENTPEENEIFSEFQRRVKELSNWVYKNLPYGQVIPDDGVDICIIIRATKKDNGVLYTSRYATSPWVNNDYAFTHIVNYIIRQIQPEDRARILNEFQSTGN